MLNTKSSETDKKYFHKFKNISEIKNAKTLSFQYTHSNAVFNVQLLNEFKLMLTHEQIFRVVLHDNVQNKLHNMVIAIKKDGFIYPHKHQKAESYQIILGKIILVYFTEDGKITHSVILSPDDTLIARVDKDTYHALIILEDSVYHETRVGPFISSTDSIHPQWCNNQNEFMKDTMKKVSI